MTYLGDNVCEVCSLQHLHLLPPYPGNWKWRHWGLPTSIIHFTFLFLRPISISHRIGQRCRIFILLCGLGFLVGVGVWRGRWRGREGEALQGHAPCALQSGAGRQRPQLGLDRLAGGEVHLPEKVANFRNLLAMKLFGARARVTSRCLTWYPCSSFSPDSWSLPLSEP